MDGNTKYPDPQKKAKKPVAGSDGIKVEEQAAVRAVEETPTQNVEVSQNDFLALYAAQMAKEAMEKLSQIQAAGNGKKKPKPDEDVVRLYESDKAKIAKQEKVQITIPAGLIGQPERYHSVVNGHHVEVIPGVPKLIPKAHYENLQMMFEQKRRNAQKSAQMERAAIQAFSK